jgi:hypothetical protein
LNDRQWHSLSGDAAKLLVSLWLVASEFGNDGTLPEISDLAFRLRMDEKKLSSLISQLDHWLEHDASSTLAERKQDAPSETETETETETEEEGAKAPVRLNANLAWQGRVIRLTTKDFECWKSAYAALDLAAELVARDAWLAEQPPDIRRRWYGSTSKFLANRNMEAKAKGQAPPPRRSELAIALDELVEKARKHDEQLGIGDGTIVGLSANGRGSPDLPHAQGFDEPIDGSGEADPFELSAKH